MEKRHYFTCAEKKEFLRIAKKYQSIIETKTYDTHTLRRKNITWDRIACEYNTSAISPYPASSKQLRRLWMNIKQRNKKPTVQMDREPHASDADIESSVDTLETADEEGEMTIGQSPAFRVAFINGNEGGERNGPTNDNELNQVKRNLLIREFDERQRKADELHFLQKQLLVEKIREARAKANLAELELGSINKR